jgi:hypothetical protein
MVVAVEIGKESILQQLLKPRPLARQIRSVVTARF